MRAGDVRGLGRRTGSTTAAGRDYDSGGQGTTTAAGGRGLRQRQPGKRPGGERKDSDCRRTEKESAPPPHPLKQALRVSDKTGGDEKGRSPRAAWAGGGRGLDEAATTPQNETMGAATATSLLL